MANNRCTYQQVSNVSIPKVNLLEIARNEELSKKDFRVLLCLFTELDGWKPGVYNTKDPQNYKKIDIKTIAYSLCMNKKDVRHAIEKLLDCDIIEEGYSDTVSNGYRFCF